MSTGGNTSKTKKEQIYDVLKDFIPIIGLCFVGIMWVSSRLEDSDTKTKRILQYTVPLDKRIDYLREEFRILEKRYETHQALGGHSVMEQRMATVERELNELRRALNK